MTKKSGLGRGLAALIGDEVVAPAPVAPVATETAKDSELHRLPVDALTPGALQPRRHFDAQALTDLANSLKNNGILQPLLVRPTGQTGQYEIVAGERRWRAAQQAQLHEVPVIVRELSDRDALEIALVENIQRADLNPIEEAEGYARLMEGFSYTQEKLAAAVGRSRPHIANTLRLLTAPPALQEHLISGALAAGHVRVLLGHNDAEQLAARAVKEGLSVRALEQLAGQKTTGRTSTSHTSQKSADIRALEKSLGDALGLKVEIIHRGESGKISVAYRTLAQLEDVIRRLR